MRKTKEHKVPLLRFPEFGGEWEKKQLGNMTNFASGGTPSKKISDYWNGTIPWISAASMHTDIIEKSEVYVTEEGVRNGTKIASIDNVLLLVRGSMLFNRIPAGICVRPVAFNQDVKALSVDENNSPRFLLFFLRAWEHRLLSLVTGTGIGAGKLDTDQLKSLPFAQPTLLEQQKIADFLSAIDNRIEQLGKKKTLFEQFKKGMMQKFFGQEIRFKDEQGNDYPDWEEKRLGDLCGYKNGGSFEKFIVAEGKYNLITLNSIDIRGHLKNIHNTVNQADWFLQQNDLIMVLSDVAHGYFLGLVDLIPTDNKYVLNQRMGLLRKKEECVNMVFLRYVINHNQSYFKKHGQGSSQQNLSKGDILKFGLKLPEKYEQQKIANFLSAIDKKIELVGSEFEKVRSFKKGLLQQMFI